MSGALLHKKGIEMTAPGRHAFWFRKGRNDDAPGFEFQVEAFRPCSQLIRVLLNPRNISMTVSGEFGALSKIYLKCALVEMRITNRHRNPTVC